MHITHLTLQNLRNYADLSVYPDQGLNILLGRNAQGKTTVLEGIYLLATARSWRAGKESELIRWDADRARVTADIVRKEQNDIEIEILLSRSEKKQVKVNTIRQTKLSELMGQMNVVLIEPLDSEIVRGDPSQRRRFLNVEISQVQPQYCHLLVSYKRVIDQRNRLLKSLQGRHHGDGVLDVWNEQLVTHGSRILERRLKFVEDIGRLARIIHSQITEQAEDLEVKYMSKTRLGNAGTAVEIAYIMRAGIDELHEEEIRRGVTLIGPQRDDLRFNVNGIDARIYGSQGQQRTVALSLRLAELELMEESTGESPIVLLDDVMTDLDEERRVHVFEMTRGRCQTFLTAASQRVLDAELIDAAKVFRVSEGRVTSE